MFKKRWRHFNKLRTIYRRLHFYNEYLFENLTMEILSIALGHDWNRFVESNDSINDFNLKNNPALSSHPPRRLPPSPTDFFSVYNFSFSFIRSRILRDKNANVSKKNQQIFFLKQRISTQRFVLFETYWFFFSVCFEYIV